MGIGKRGDKHLRTLLIHGARSVVPVSQGRTDTFSRRVNSIRERRGVNRAIVAVANNEPLSAIGPRTMASARIICAMLRRNEELRAHA